MERKPLTSPWMTSPDASTPEDCSFLSLLEIIPCYQPDTFSLSVRNQPDPDPLWRKLLLLRVCADGLPGWRGGGGLRISVCKHTCHRASRGVQACSGEMTSVVWKCESHPISMSVTVYDIVCCAAHPIPTSTETCWAASLLSADQCKYCTSTSPWELWSQEDGMYVWAVWAEILQPLLGSGE